MPIQPSPSAQSDSTTNQHLNLLSPVMLGSWSLIGDANWGQQSRADSEAAIEASLESGITAFDTAPAYGDGAAESLLGDRLSKRREQVFLATKFRAPLTETNIRQSLEDSLRRLQTDYIDLYQIHWPDSSTPIAQTAEVLLALQTEGKIRAIGVSNFGPRDLEEAARVMPIATNQMPYSLLWRGVEFAVLPLCQRLGIRILSYSSLLQGLLTGKFHSTSDVPEGRARTKHFSSHGRPKIKHGEPGHESTTFDAIKKLAKLCHEIDIPMSVAALSALLNQPTVSSVIMGARNATQAQENARVLKTRLNDSSVQKIFEATEKLKQEIGPELDPWLTPTRIH